MLLHASMRNMHVGIKAEPHDGDAGGPHDAEAGAHVAEAGAHVAEAATLRSFRRAPTHVT